MPKKLGIKCQRCGGDMKPMADKKTWLCPSHNCLAIERNGHIIGVMKFSSWKFAPQDTNKEPVSECD